MPSWQDFRPSIMAGLALGGVYALSGVGMVVLYRATGVLNLAFGAVGAMGAFIAWTLTNDTGFPDWAAHVVASPSVAWSRSGTRPLRAAARRPRPAREGGRHARPRADPARRDVVDLERRGTIDDPADVGIGVPRRPGPGQLDPGHRAHVRRAAHPRGGRVPRYTNLGTAMRALANDREITATLGVPVRRIEAAAWLGSGLISGFAGLLLSNLVGLDAATLTFLVSPSLAAALIARLRSLVVIVVGVVTAMSRRSSRSRSTATSRRSCVRRSRCSTCRARKAAGLSPGSV
jgi:branched-chain amino acid transport system permease protein